MDATGVTTRLSPYASISIRKGVPKRCFLYVITLYLEDGTSMPVYQMLSQLHSSIQINNMLSLFKVENQHRIPHEFVMDKSAALLLSTLLTFTSSTSVHEHVDHCYESLFENRDSMYLTRSMESLGIKNCETTLQPIHQTSIAALWVFL